MLNEAQALEVVRGSVRKALASKKKSNLELVPVESATLGGLGISDDSALRNLAVTIVSDPNAGVPRLQHYLDPNKLANLSINTTIGDLKKLVLELSAGKLCSNPAKPHEQSCCPYPSTCPECGYPVL